MLLLNARTYALKFFHTAETAPPYAILSHTWEDDEVLFKDMDDLERAKAKSGWQKIEYICRQALEDGLEWAWVDTCCIDKSSSAELSEAINSMFNWYECSAVCYVYLCDLTMSVTLRDDAPTVSEWLEQAKQMTPGVSGLNVHGSNYSATLWKGHVAYLKKVASETMSRIRKRVDDEGSSRPCNELDLLLIETLEAFSKAKWWSRGWTLQELLAPRNVAFMDQHWQLIARLPELVVTVSTVSSVDVEVLLKTAPLKSRCVAERLSWASRRSTTREEDTAYALLGIFDVNMPLLYGEGSRAFKRLQEVISLRSNDLSIYAWLTLGSLKDHDPLFAASPSHFTDCTVVRKGPSAPATGISASFEGVTFTSLVSRNHGRYWIGLGCYDISTPDQQIVLMVKPREGLFEKMYISLGWKARAVHPEYLTATTKMSKAFAQRARPRSLTITQSQTEHRGSIIERVFAARITMHLPRETCWPVENAHPREFWNLHTNQFYCAQRDLNFPLTAGLEFKSPDGHPVCLVLRLYQGSPRGVKHTVSSSVVYDLQHRGSYRIFAKLVSGLALDQACTQFSPSWTPNSSLADVTTRWHPFFPRNASSPAVAGGQLRIEVEATEGKVVHNGMILFDIFIHTTTLTAEPRHMGRLPRFKRKPQSTPHDPSTAAN